MSTSNKKPYFLNMCLKLPALFRRKPAGSPPPPLLQLPPELILTICDHLATDPASRCSLAMACKYLFAVLARNGKPPPLEMGSRNSFLSLLERDLGERFYLCCSCSKLRRFDKSWGPTRPDRSCAAKSNSVFSEGNYRLGYHHVRLVMNYHRSGGTKGIPLKNLNQTAWVQTFDIFKRRPGGLWCQTWSALVISNELFLSVQHTLQARTDKQLRQALATSSYAICPHIDINQMPGSRPWGLRPAPLEDRDLEACWEFPGSCSRCLTDYILTIERPQASAGHSKRGRCRISITSFHQLGDGMSPDDWKWEAYRGSRPTSGPVRNVQECPAGLIMETWNSGHP